jgi:hypothetical protein
MSGDPYQRWVNVNLPHARTVAARIGRSLEALGAFGAAGDGDGSRRLALAWDDVEQALRGFDEDPPMDEALRAADHVAGLGRVLVAAIADSGVRSDRLGQHVRNLFECLGLPEEGASLSLRCGERPDSPLR